MKRSQAFPTKFLSKDDITAPTVGIIEKVVMESLGFGESQEIKPVMYFQSGIPKPMAINNINWINVESLYGDESDNWSGKPIEVYVDPNVAFGGKRIGGLRLRAPAGQQASQAGGNGGQADYPTEEQWTLFFDLVEVLGTKGITVPVPPDNVTQQGLLKIIGSLRARLKPPRPEGQVLQELGYEPQPGQPEPAPAMTLEEAAAMTGTDGVKYGDLDTPKLSIKATSLLKVKDRTPEQQRKLEALQLVLKSRELKEKAAA